MAKVQNQKKKKWKTKILLGDAEYSFVFKQIAAVTPIQMQRVVAHSKEQINPLKLGQN